MEGSSGPEQPKISPSERMESTGRAVELLPPELKGMVADFMDYTAKDILA